MKLGDQKVELRKQVTVPLEMAGGDVLKVQINRLPPNTDDVLDKLFPVPARPRRFVMSKKGVPLRDPDTGEVLTEVDDSANPITDKIEKARDVRAAVVGYLALRESLTFESVNGYDFEDNPEGIAEHADELVQEFRDAGFGPGHFLLVREAANALAGLNMEWLERARKSFS